MKFRPTACWRMRTSPAAGAGTCTASYTRASGPPTLCTRTALVMSDSPSALPPDKAKAIEGGLSTHQPRGIAGQLFNGLLAVTLGQRFQELDGRGKCDGKTD